MFTGIVEELGAILAIDRGERSAQLTVGASLVTSDATHGCSISVSGVCLTVTDYTPDTLTFDVMDETLQRSTLQHLGVGDAVNLERAVPVHGRLGGHIVQGHVDGTATLLEREPGERWEVLTFALPSDLSPYLATKGSITLDGVSLTVASVATSSFSVALIPTTLALTTLGALPLGRDVNLEADVVAKYLERLIAARDSLEVSR